MSTRNTLILDLYNAAFQYGKDPTTKNYTRLEDACLALDKALNPVAPMGSFDSLLENYRVSLGRFANGVMIRHLDGEVDLGKRERDALAARDAVRMKNAEATGQDLRVGTTGVSVTGIRVEWANADQNEILTTGGEIFFEGYGYRVEQCRFKLDDLTMGGLTTVCIVWDRKASHRLGWKQSRDLDPKATGVVLLAEVCGSDLKVRRGPSADPKVPRYETEHAQVLGAAERPTWGLTHLAEVALKAAEEKGWMAAHFLQVDEPVEFEQRLDEALKAEADKVRHHNAYPTLRGEKLVRANNARQRVMAAFGQLKSRRQRLLDACKPFEEIAQTSGSFGTVQVSALAVRDLAHAAAELKR